MWIELLFGASWLIDTWVIKDLEEKLLFLICNLEHHLYARISKEESSSKLGVVRIPSRNDMVFPKLFWSSLDPLILVWFSQNPFDFPSMVTVVYNLQHRKDGNNISI